MRTLSMAVGGVTAAFTSALCCAGPILAVTAGVSAAGLSATFEPVRPYLLVATAGLLMGGFYSLHREERAACDPDQPCAEPQARRRMRVILWVATALAIVFATYPRWQTLII